MAVTIPFKKFSLNQHNLLKLRTIVYVSLGVFLLYCSKHMHRRTLSDEMEKFRINHSIIKMQIANYRNTSVGYCIHGLENLLKEFLANIQNLRQTMLDPEEPVKKGWGFTMWGKGKKHTLHHQVEGYFDILEKDFPFVKTVFLERETTKVGIFLNDDYYHYVSNNCDLLESKNSQYTQRFRELYNASCYRNVSASMESVTLADRMRSLDIGMPAKFQQAVHSKLRKWTYIHLIQNAIVSTYGEVTAHNLSLYPYGCDQVAGYGYFQKKHAEVFTISGASSAHFYHNIISDLPRLAPYIPFLLKHPEIKVHVGERSEFHTLLGLSPDRLVTGAVEARLLYMPAGFPCDTSDVLNLQLLSYYLRRNLPNISRERNKVILVKKTYNRYTRFRYHNEILQMLKQEAELRTLQVVEYADDPRPSLDVTQKMFNTAIMIVAPHGVGLSHLVFCQPGTVVIEGLHQKDSSGQTDMSYTSLALALGLRYYGVYFDNKSVLDYSASDLRVPVQEYLGRLNAVRRNINQPF